jgi:hypothetical protein
VYLEPPCALNARCVYVCSRRRPGRRSAAQLLTRGEAWRIAANAKLPEAVTAITRGRRGDPASSRFRGRPPAGMALARPRSPSRRSLIGLGLKRNAAEVSSQVGYTINGSRLNRDSNEARRIAANIAKLPELLKRRA